METLGYLGKTPLLSAVEQESPKRAPVVHVYRQGAITGLNRLVVQEHHQERREHHIFIESAIMFGFGNNKPGRTVEECQDMIKRSFQKPMVKFLREKLAKAGCNVGDDFFHAVNCEKDVSGGYISGYGIQVCSNQITLQDEVNQVIIHELIHAYDDCRAANMDWSNCAHHACSEIRAGHLSGDCHFKRELLRNGFHKLRGHESECVKRRVMKSVMNNPYCSEAAARDAMDAVWDTCYNDTQPFDRAP